jgi:hypothetical protein
VVSHQSTRDRVFERFVPSCIRKKGKGRLKGKARAAKKEKDQTHQVPLVDIPRIAKAIASTERGKVPEIIIRTLEEVIAARSACNECFE